MPFVSPKEKKIHCKIVYYGPARAGKTTNLNWIYQEASGDQKIQLNEINTDLERTLFFDFLPVSLGGEVHGFDTRFHLYTVPGQPIYDASRKLILTGLDGIVFVADSQMEKMTENIESMDNLEKNLSLQGLNIQNIPLVLQYNKRDLPNAESISKMRKALNRYGSPDFEAVASQGTGVLESIKSVSKSILHVLQGNPVL